jgi:hypothetical protein
VDSVGCSFWLVGFVQKVCGQARVCLSIYGYWVILEIWSAIGWFGGSVFWAEMRVWDCGENEAYVSDIEAKLWQTA